MDNFVKNLSAVTFRRHLPVILSAISGRTDLPTTVPLSLGKPSENCGKGDVGGSGGQKFYKFLDEDAYKELFETQMETDMVFNIACNAVQVLIYRGLSSFWGIF